MEIHDRITPQMVEKFESRIRQSPLVVMDGNIPRETMNYILGLCKDATVPVWFEPTDLRKAAKPFSTDLWKTMSFISPNLNELRMIAKSIGVCSSSVEIPISEMSPGEVLEETCSLAKELAEHIYMVLVTLGHLGVMVVRKGTADDILFQAGKLVHTTRNNDPVSARLYSCPQVEKLVNVSGAGDCFAAGFIVAMLQGLSECRCAAVGTSCAALALQTSSAVPAQLVPAKNTAWSLKACFQQLL
ncbi:uncharacterized protein [Anabrus simplex]